MSLGGDFPPFWLVIRKSSLAEFWEYFLFSYLAEFYTRLSRLRAQSNLIANKPAKKYFPAHIFQERKCKKLLSRQKDI